MKALSLREPWLTAVLDLGKRIENRRWGTDFRGRFLLHAAKGMTRVEYGDACDFIQFEAGHPAPQRSQLRANGIAGAATLVDVLSPEERVRHRDMDAQRRILATPELNLDWWMREQFGFILTDVVAFPNVIPCVGMLGFFEVPPEIERAAREAMAA